MYIYNSGIIKGYISLLSFIYFGNILGNAGKQSKSKTQVIETKQLNNILPNDYLF